MKTASELITETHQHATDLQKQLQCDRNIAERLASDRMVVRLAKLSQQAETALRDLLETARTDAALGSALKVNPMLLNRLEQTRQALISL